MKKSGPLEQKKSRYFRFLKSIPLFACFSDEEIIELEKTIIEKDYAKNELILLEEDTSHYMYIVYSGKVKVVQIGVEGKERILAIHKRGDFFGEMAILDGKTTPATVIAMEPVTAGLMSKENFERTLLKNEKAQLEIISLLCSRLREAWLMLKVMSFADAEHRIRAVLGHLSSIYGVKDQRGTIVALRLTHKDIADYASVSRETATRFIDKFCKEGEIELLEHKQILLKPSFLENTSFL